MNLSNLISQGENSGVEFKNENVSAEGLAKEIVAFSNSLGGHILIGVEDDGTITGINQSKRKWEEWIMNICRDHVNPPISDLSVNIISSKGKCVLLIQVPKGKEKPYQNYKSQFLIRVGSTNRIASQLELLRLFQQSGMFHFDGTAVSRTSYSDLDLNRVQRYFEQYSIDFSKEEQPEQVLKNIDIVHESGALTVAGLLIFGIDPQRHLQNASISFAHFKGNVISDHLIDKKVIDGTLDNQIDQCLAAIKNNLVHGSIIEGAKTVDKEPRYPDRVFRELIVNACLHRNYAIPGSRIRIFMYDDRIEFHSPGRLPNTVTIEKMKRGVSYTINPIILKFMENLRYVDRLGRGIPLVFQAASKMNKQLELEEIGEEFVVRLEL